MIKIGIIGAGFGGISIAYYLKNLKNCEITIIESEKNPGGIASGFKMPKWDWYMDDVIHHWFTSTDKEVLELIKDLNLQKELIFKNTKSSCYYNGKIAELDSILSLLKFPFLNLIDKIRMGLIMALLRLDKNYLRYENISSYDFIRKTMGKNSFKIMWEPLFLGKFGKYAKEVNAVWFWARINPRTKTLIYFKGGFQCLVNEIAKNLEKKGINLILNSSVESVEKKDKKFIVKTKNKKNLFDILIVATPLPVFLKITKNLPKDYTNKLKNLKMISAQYFVLELKKSFLKDKTYWLNVNEKEFPFMMVAEHTNFVNKKNYNNSHLIWVGKYLDKQNKLWGLDEKNLLKIIIPYLKKINSEFKESWIISSSFKRFEYAQPIIEKNYSKKMPKTITPIEDLYILNMHHIYPWDRGTSNAITIAIKIAKKIKNKALNFKKEINIS